MSADMKIYKIALIERNRMVVFLGSLLSKKKTPLTVTFHSTTPTVPGAGLIGNGPHEQNKPSYPWRHNNRQSNDNKTFFSVDLNCLSTVFFLS